MTQELMQRLGIQSPETAEKVEQFLLALEERNRLLTEKSQARLTRLGLFRHRKAGILKDRQSRKGPRSCC